MYVQDLILNGQDNILFICLYQIVSNKKTKNKTEINFTTRVSNIIFSSHNKLYPCILKLLFKNIFGQLHHCHEWKSGIFFLKKVLTVVFKNMQRRP